MESSFGRVGDTAIIDAASACGLQMVPVLERNTLVTTSRGLGELLLAAYGCGCTRVLVGIGGTATCDGGEGMMSVPGLKDLRGKINFLQMWIRLSLAPGERLPSSHRRRVQRLG